MMAWTMALMMAWTMVFAVVVAAVLQVSDIRLVTSKLSHLLMKMVYRTFVSFELRPPFLLAVAACLFFFPVPCALSNVTKDVKLMAFGPFFTNQVTNLCNVPDFSTPATV